MERLIFVPIEKLEERYSSQWWEWFAKAFDEQKIDFITVGDQQQKTIKTGQFLDVYETNSYKLNQLQQIITILQNNPKEDFTIFFMDCWFPGVETVAYIRSCTDRRVTLKGMAHAGTWDKYDFLTQKGCAKWSKGFEQSLFQIFDEVYVATEFHKSLIQGYFADKVCKLTVVDFPVIDPEDHGVTKEDIVVFPHRLAFEKQPDVFDRIEKLFKKRYPDFEHVQFIKSKNVCNTKSEYYSLLRRSKVAVSCALQETFGIAMLEAYHLGCFPVVPDRLSYRETFESRYRYDGINEVDAIDLIRYGLVMNQSPVYKYGSKIKWAHKIMEKT